MQYSSGKTKISKRVSDTIISYLNNKGVLQRGIQAAKQEYRGRLLRQSERERESNESILVSLFCGGLSVEVKLAPYFKNVICNDKQPYLIELYKAIQNGWVPPDELTVEEYYHIKEHKDENPALTGFAGFGCSFGGKWFGGYGRHGVKDKHASERSMCEESKRALMRDLNVLSNADFICMDYKDVILPNNCVIYADPPYAGKMAAYGIKEQFDTEEFWNWARTVGKSHPLFISELTAPDDFEIIWEKPVLRQLANCNADNFVTTEKLFVLKNGVNNG